MKAVSTRGVLLGVMLSLVGCSSASKKAPELDGASLPLVKFQALSPRVVQLSVQNRRTVNLEAGNAAEVEEAVRRALTSALERGGIKVKETASNKFNVVISDYPSRTTQGECVKVNIELRAKWGNSLVTEGFGCHTLKHLIGFTLGGDLSEAYRQALLMKLEYLENNQMKLIGR